jgi:hypothetical protein
MELRGSSISGIAANRKQALKCRFPQEIGTFNALKKSMGIPEMF